MLKFFQRDLPAAGSVLYRGTLPPRGEEFSFLEAAGATVKEGKAGGNALWLLKLNHPEWGEADLVAFRDIPPLPTRSSTTSRTSRTPRRPRPRLLGPACRCG